MCGIAGFRHRGTSMATSVIERQLQLLAHRGPDSSGYFIAGDMVIGQTRLAVIDPTTGDPPVCNEDGTIGVSLNGEIYNYRELRQELLARGHPFQTGTDTEVLAHLCEELGPSELARCLKGMFAFAVADRHRRRLILGRDRLGKKPLYYWTDGTSLVFASEIKAVLSHPEVPKRLNCEVVPDFLTFGYAPTPDTFFEGVHSVPPGHVLVFDADGPPTLEQYWKLALPGLDDVERVELSLTEAATEVRQRLADAVRRRLVADVPLGAFLSGGVDSSSVVALMAEMSTKPVRTFTVGFQDEGGFDERPFARMVSERFGTEHTEFVVQPHAIELLEPLLWHHDQPFGDSSALPTYLVSKLTRPHVTVALCGDGGDELFAGYQRFTAGMFADLYGRVPMPPRRLFKEALRALPGSMEGRRLGRLKRFEAHAEAGLPDAYLAWVSLAPPGLHSQLVNASPNRAMSRYRDLFQSTDGAHALDRLLHLNLQTYLLDDLLPKVDRMSMAHALEVRSPLLDHELVEFAFRLPPELKASGLSRKRVLKAAMKAVLPRQVLYRGKQGFALPLARWLRSDLRGHVGGLLGARARVRHHVNSDGLDRLVAEHDKGQADHAQAIWALLTLEVFLRREGW